MVKSRIDPSIDYPEPQGVAKEDKGSAAYPYVYPMQKVGGSIIIVVGKADTNSYKSKGIAVFPVYLVKKNNQFVRVGIYELLVSKLASVVDEEGNLELEKTKSAPIWFKESVKEFDKRKVPDNEEKEKEKEEEEQTGGGKDEDDDEEVDLVNTIPEHLEDTFIMVPGHGISPRLKTETEKQAKQIRDAFVETSQSSWIERFMKNPYYSIEPNEGGVDSLFASIRDAFSQIHQQTSVQKLRAKIASLVKEPDYLHLKSVYDIFHRAFLEKTDEVKRLEGEYQRLQEKFRQLTDREQQKRLVVGANDVKKVHERELREKQVLHTIMQEYALMKGADSFDKWKRRIHSMDTPSGTDWFVHALEDLLQIKIILFQQDAFPSKKGGKEVADLDHVVKVQFCKIPTLALQNPTPDYGFRKTPVESFHQKDDPKDKPVRYYILIARSPTNTYNLVRYKKKLLFTFSEIPYDLKRMIHDRCLENEDESLVDFIKERKLMKGGGSPALSLDIDLLDSKVRGMYNDQVVFVFYKNSSDKRLPGMGPGEKIDPEETQRPRFLALANFADWRKKLSDEWILDAPFTLDNKRWASVTHYYEASKYKKENYPFYLSFSLDANTDLSKDVKMAKAVSGNAKAATRKNTSSMRPESVTEDRDFYSIRGEGQGRDQKERFAAQFAKFSQNPDLKNLLLFTHDAKLMEHQRGKPPVLAETLMQVRDKLRQEVSQRQ
jgi:hypothetical protein